MATFDNDLLSKEHLHNIDNDNEGGDDVDDSSSDNEEMKKMLVLSFQNATLYSLFKTIYDNYKN